MVMQNDNSGDLAGVIPGIVPPDQASNFSPEELKNNIDRGLEVVENKRKNLDTTEIIDDNQLEEIKSKVIAYFFDMLKGFGVDPNDINSVREFILKLEEKSPDLADLFDFIFNELFKTPGQMPTAITPGMPTAGATPMPQERFGGLMKGMAEATPVVTPTESVPPPESQPANLPPELMG